MRVRSTYLAPALDDEGRRESPPLVAWSWQAEGVSKLAVLVVGAVLGLLVWRASGGSWTLVALVVGAVLILLIVATHPAVIAGIVQLRRDALTARVRLEEVRADYVARRAQIEAQRQAEMERLRLQGELRAEADRKLIWRAGEASEPIALEDPLRDLAVTLICEAYQHHEADGLVPLGIFSRRRVMEAGFAQAQYEELAELLKRAEIARFEKQRWYLNTQRYRDAEEATRALVRVWEGGKP